MKALSFSEFGNPEAVLTYEECAVSEPKAGEVCIRMIFAPIHNHHLWYIKGMYGIKPALPAVSGDEAIGIIEKIGAGVRGLRVGQKVIACKMWGAWAEMFLAKATDVVPVPKGISDEAAAQLFSMPLSTMMLLGMTGAKAGDWIIQNAANGAVGKMLAGIAATRRIKVVSLVRSERAKSEMTALNLENVIVTSDTNWQAQVLALTGGHTAVAGVDSLGGEPAMQVLSLLKDGGTLISFGAQTKQPLMIDPSDLIFQNKQVRGFWATRSAKEMSLKVKIKIFINLIKALFSGKLTLSEGGGLNIARLSKALALKNLAEMLKAGKIHLPVAGVFPLSAYKKALDLSEQSGRNGKVLFRP